jgi:hypothetical protein
VAQRTGKELTDNEVEIIADTTKEMGHDIGKVSLALAEYKGTDIKSIGNFCG